MSASVKIRGSVVTVSLRKKRLGHNSISFAESLPRPSTSLLPARSFMTQKRLKNLPQRTLMYGKCSWITAGRDPRTQSSAPITLNMVLAHLRPGAHEQMAGLILNPLPIHAHA